MSFLGQIGKFFASKIPGKSWSECDLCTSQAVVGNRTCCDDCLLEIGRWLYVQHRNRRAA